MQKNQLKPELEGLVTYLIDQDLINPQVIQKYTVLKAFKEGYLGNRGQKNHTVEMLADRFNLSTRTVWSILKHKDDAR